MKNSVIIFSCLLVVFAASKVSAKCSEDKTETTIVSPTGKVITICIPDNAIPFIGEAEDIVIPAVCPCFSQEDIEKIYNQACEIVNFSSLPEEQPCLYGGCTDADNKIFADYNFGVANVSNYCFARPFLWPAPYDETVCFLSSSHDYEMITTEQANACLAIIETFAEMPPETTAECQYNVENGEMLECLEPESYGSME